MSYETYKWLHIFSALCLFLAIGFLLARANNKDDKAGSSKKIMILHGLSVLVLLVSGFGLIARLQLHSFPPWVNIKIMMWVVLALLVPLALRLSRKKYFTKFCISTKYDKMGIWFIVLVSGLLAVYMGVLKFGA